MGGGRSDRALERERMRESEKGSGSGKSPKWVLNFWLILVYYVVLLVDCSPEYLLYTTEDVCKKK